MAKTAARKVKPAKPAWLTKPVMRKRKLASITPTQTQTAVAPRSTEIKIKDIAATAYQVDSATSVTLLNGMTKGTDSGNRIGRRIVVKTIDIRGLLFSDLSIDLPGALTHSPAQQGRLLVVYDREAKGAAPTVAQVIVSVQGQYTEANLGRFIIICDKTFVFGPMAVASTGITDGVGPQAYNVHEHFDGSWPVSFNAGDAGTVADIDRGSIYMLWIGSVATGANTVQLNGSTRIQYTDN